MMKKPSLIGSLIPLYLAVAIGALAGASSARADEIESAPEAPAEVVVGVTLYTYHFDRSMGYNNYNPGVYAAYNGWTGGVFYNSERRVSVYGGYVFRRVLGSPIDVTVGAVSGYEIAALFPVVVPSVLISDHLRMSFLMAPQKSGWGLNVAYEF